MRYRWIYSTLGLVLGIGAPAGWFFWRAVSLHHDWWADWARNELQQQGAIYSYLTLATVVAFTLFGYFLGRILEREKNETRAAKIQVESLNRLATTDGLTNLFNARYLHNQLAIEMEEAQRYNFPLSCLLIDIDFFKRINDEFGHPYGDVVLITLAKILKTSLRRIDIVGRLGGEEFLALLPHTPLEVAASVGERIRSAVENFPFDYQKKPVHLTVSIGAVAYPDQRIHSKNHLLKAADEALYAAKESGRNKVAIWNEMSRQELSRSEV